MTAGEPDVLWLADELHYRDAEGVPRRVTRNECATGEVKLSHHRTYKEARKALADYYANWRDSFAHLARTTRYRAEHEMWAHRLPRRLQPKRLQEMDMAGRPRSHEE